MSDECDDETLIVSRIDFSHLITKARPIDRPGVIDASSDAPNEQRGLISSGDVTDLLPVPYYLSISVMATTGRLC